MQNNPAQKESRIVLVILGALLVCICLSLAGIVVIGTTQGPQITHQIETQVAMPNSLTRQHSTSVYATATDAAQMPLLYAEDFSAPNTWWVGNSDTQFAKADCVIQEGKLICAYTPKKPFVSQVWPNSAHVHDFYFALDTRIVDGAPEDRAGMVFLAQDRENDYRFEITNQSTFGVQREKDGDWTWLLRDRKSEAIRPNEMNRLAVHVQNGIFTFFINGQYVGQVADSTFSEGAIGISYNLTRPGSTVKLENDNLELRALPSQQENAKLATATSWQPTLTAMATHTPSVSDDFSNVVLGYNWPLGTFKGNRIEAERSITDGVYRWDLKALQGVSWYAIPRVSERDDFIARLKVKWDENSSNGSAGIVFRFQDSDNYYKFSIRPNLEYNVSARHLGAWQTYVNWHYSQALRPTDWNTLQVIGRGDRFSFWLNDVYVDSVQSPKIEAGKIGIGIELDAGETARIEFDNFEIIPLPSSRPPTNTPSRTIPPSPSATATPYAPFVLWKILLNDDFSSHNDSWEESIQNSATRRFVRNIKSGAYTWIATNTASDDEFLSIPKIDTVADFAATTNIYGSPRAQVGMVYRYTDDSNYYRFLAGDDGQFRIEARVNGEWKQLLQGYANSLGADKRPHKLGVIAQGDNFLFFINDVQIARLRDKQHTQGKIGLALATKAGETIDLSFDNFQVRVP